MIELIKDKQCEMHLDGRPLVLIPLVFARGVLMGESQDEQAVALGYQARGTAALWTAETAGFDGRLELLLGHGRAAVLRALDRPATTTDLARRLSYAPSTVSAHLDVLSRAGLVERHRVRRGVFYILRALAATRYATPLPSRCTPARPAQPSYGAKKARTSSSVTRARGLPVTIRPTTRR
jgi:DNA-binding transcriptional ArsR family regulator